VISGYLSALIKEVNKSMRLYFIRHGESAANLLHEFSNSGHKHPLTENGFAQAQSLARRLSGLSVAQVYTSPILRAQQTAQVLADSLQAPLQINQALQEWSVGIYEGTSDPRGWERYSQVQQDWFVHQKWDSKMPGGESFLEIQGRFIPFIEG
jgi:broad specificity phosphatase PhoE